MKLLTLEALKIPTELINNPKAYYLSPDIPKKGLPFRYTDYPELVDWSGRILREDKRGAIPEDKPEILVRLNLDAKHWTYLTKDFESPFKSLVGTAYRIRQVCQETGRCWVHGIRRCADIFPET